jgi:hypothetical protein
MQVPSNGPPDALSGGQNRRCQDKGQLSVSPGGTQVRTLEIMRLVKAHSVPIKNGLVGQIILDGRRHVFPAENKYRRKKKILTLNQC